MSLLELTQMTSEDALCVKLFITAPDADVPRGELLQLPGHWDVEPWRDLKEVSPSTLPKAKRFLISHASAQGYQGHFLVPLLPEPSSLLSQELKSSLAAKTSKLQSMIDSALQVAQRVGRYLKAKLGIGS